MAMSRETKPGKIGAWIALGLSIALAVRVIAIDNPEALVIVAPALVGALLAVAWPQMRVALLTGLVLIGVTATFSLIGWIGLLFIPSMVLIGLSAYRISRTPTLQP
ncbi:MAG TPA: hypothetical protein VIH70_03125 [Actinomycetota bacterium]